jgi:hypothetical protein
MKNFNIFSPLVFTLLLLFSTGSQCGYENIDISEQREMIEVLYGVEIYSDSFEFQVLSNGCTHSDHFKLQANQLNDDQISIQLIRTKQDLCRALPWLINIKVAIPFSDILYPKFIFTNPFKNKHSLKNTYGN